MFKRKKDKSPSFSDVFSVVPGPTVEEYNEAMLTPVGELFETLIQLVGNVEQWNITELAETDEYGYANYDIVHKTKPITIGFESYDNENEAIILIAGEDVVKILGTDLASQIVDKAYNLIYDRRDELDAIKLERNNEAATRLLGLIGRSLTQ